MRITKLFLICMCCVMVAPAVWAQTANSPQPGILGYLDPHTGAFRPVPAVAEDSLAAPAAATFTGTINLTITVTLKTAGLPNITCTEEASVNDGTTSFSSFAESNTVAATGTGTTRTCKLSIPYSWLLTNQASDNMSTSYTVVGSNGPTVPQRSSSHFPLDTRKVQANGAITTLTAAVSL